MALPPTPMPYGHAFQRAVLRLMCVDLAFCVRAMEYLAPEHFTSPAYGWVLKIISDYWQTYQSQPSDMIIREAARSLPRDKAPHYLQEIDAIAALGPVPEKDYVVSQLTDFCKRAVFAVSHQESARLFNAGKPDEAYDLMARAQEQIALIEFDKADRVWLFDELDDRQRARVRATFDPLRMVWSTGIPELDKLTDGGVHPTEIWALITYAKRGKTTFLVNQGFHAARLHRSPTAHFVFEGTSQQIAARYDARFSQELYSKVKRGEIDARVYRALQLEYQALRRLMVIRTVNDWDVNILTIQNELQYLKSQGFVPAKIIVDYCDLGRARERVDSEQQHQLYFTRDLKRFCNQNELACWTAFQAQKPKPGAHQKPHILTSGNVADCYAKCRIIDSWGSANMTDDEKERGEMRLFWEDHRDHPVGRMWSITNDFSRMTMATSVIDHTPVETGSEFADG